MSWLQWMSRLFGVRPKIPTAPADAAAGAATMPRRLLVMVRELHGMGYERLRAVAGLSPSGCHWRLHVTPAIGFAPPDQGVDFMARINQGVAVGDWVVYV